MRWAGSRLLQLLSAPVSEDTGLRRVKAPSHVDHTEDRVRVLAVDDWAWRKQESYGTILMDLERRTVAPWGNGGAPHPTSL